MPVIENDKRRPADPHFLQQRDIRDNEFKMQSLSIVRTSDLSRDARLAVEYLLGRSLADDEEVGIWASSPHAAPSGEARRAAWEELDQHLDLMASKASDVKDPERLADEVAAEVRHPRQ